MLRYDITYTKYKNKLEEGWSGTDFIRSKLTSVYF